jgi:eukaryotic-like serine/threonine-protein kinase
MTRLLLLAALAAAPSLAQSNFRGNNAHTGVYASAGPKKFGGLKWTFKAGGPIVTSPAIDQGVLYFGAMDGHLYAIAQDTGLEKWNFKSRMPIASSPAVANGMVYFVSSAGSLAALDAATGKPKWVLPTEYERRFEARHLHGLAPEQQTIPDGWDIFTSSPTVANGKVYFGSGDGNVYAADAQTGMLQWKFATKDVVHASPAVVDKTVYLYAIM